MNNYKKIEIFFIIVGLCLINRFLYILMPLDFEHLAFTYNLKKIDYPLTVSFIFFILSCFNLLKDYLYYNIFKERESITINMDDYNIEEKKHSFLFWSIICFPLLLCPLPSNFFSFLTTATLIFLIAILIAKHSNELILNPLFFFNGKTLYEIKGINNSNIYFIILNKKYENAGQIQKKQYLIIKNNLLLEKD